MSWAGIALLLAGLAAGALWRWLATHRAGATGPAVAGYAETKRRIRAGTSEAAPPEPPAAVLPEPAPLDEVFVLADPEFLRALEHRTALKVQRSGWRALSPSEAALLSVCGLETEVNNGGFDQFFFNSAGDEAREALAGLELVGAVHAAAIVRRAMELFGRDGPSRSREERWKQMDRWTTAQQEQLSRLDQEFYEYPDPIAERMARHCRAHRQELEP